MSRDPHSDDLLDWSSDPATSFYFARDSCYRHPVQLETSERDSLALRSTPPSPPVSISSQQSSSTMSMNSMGPTASSTVADSNSPRASLGDQSEGDHNAEPYSKLIYRALKEADGHKLSLQQIYDWFMKNTSKGRDNSKGWQNSIRHNLSMNKGFEASKIEGCTRKKPQNLWALTQDAIDRGNVESTTRYRKSNHRKATSSSSAYPGRQRSGSKGGKAAKNAARTRHLVQRERDRERQFPSPTQSRTQQPQPQPSNDPASALLTPPFGGALLYQLEQVYSGLPPSESPVKEEFDYSKVIGCTSSPLGKNSIFYDVVGPVPSYGPLDLEHIGGWYPVSGPHNRLIAGLGRR
ncbi:uncharacterized protein N7477_000751 [Penicillium maclennaniae]|uniref:uncharacterized protein n=1 Tax=Penicillium maclennaniae TaxID=1343394 RepID=UPI002540CFBA|nr:uncharacterized protein N7477_000751 [Penicillium maclennaniae]KAJ5684406.1 hypothetical protein N7477_000751 [Penicillium maclennaniae]